jgi:hypothetical protein
MALRITGVLDFAKSSWIKILEHDFSETGIVSVLR